MDNMINLSFFLNLLYDKTEVVLHDMDGKELYTGRADMCPANIRIYSDVIQMRYIRHSDKYHITIERTY